MSDVPREAGPGQGGATPPPYRNPQGSAAPGHARPLPVPAISAPVPAIRAPIQGFQPAAYANHQRADVPPFHFDGGAGSYFVTGLLAFLVIVCSFGIATPFAIVLFERWRANHTYIEGRRLMFTGTGLGLFGNWVKWWLLILVTLGIYSFWVVPRLTKWRIEHQAFAPHG